MSQSDDFSDVPGLSDEEIRRRDEEMRKLAEKMCGRCYDEVDELFPPNCAEKPEALLGAPLGQYHCPDCGAMVMAGIPHPTMCKLCIERKHPAFDVPPCPKCQSLEFTFDHATQRFECGACHEQFDGYPS